MVDHSAPGITYIELGDFKLTVRNGEKSISTLDRPFGSPIEEESGVRDLRSFIIDCEKKLPKEFVRVSKEVDAKYEITALIRKLDLTGRRPLVFSGKVKRV